MLVGLLQSERRFDELAEVYQNILEADPKDVDARVRHADALANGGHAREAAAEFEAALKGDPENVIAMVGLAMVHRELKELDQAEELLQKALAKEPDNAPARFTLAGVYEDRRELDKAIEEWKKLLALPGEGEEVKARQAEYWAHLGFAYGELDRHEEAVDAFAKAKDLAGEDERFETFFVQALLNAARPADARKALDEALAQHPESPRLRLLDTQVLQASGETEKALEKALELSQADPKNEMAIQAVVDIYQKQKAYGDAEAFLESKVGALPESAAVRFQLGAMLERQKKFDEAEAAFKKVLELEPDSAAALNYLGYMLADRGVRLEESVQYIQRALTLDPHNGAYLDSLGWAYFRMGKLDLAEDNLLQAVRSLRLTGVVYDHLGDLYFQKGNLDRAISYWKKALDQDDDELEKDRVARKIEEASSPR
jgi:tetratricopeptide (TPR) repeat protein